MKKNIEKKRACLTSWDGTLRNGYALHDWLLYLYVNSTIDSFGYADFSFHSQRYKEGEIPYELLLYESYKIQSQCLKGQEFNKIAAETEAFINGDMNSSLFDFTLDLLKLLNHKDIDIIVVSGGPSLPLKSYNNFVPFRHVCATEIKVSNTGFFTGSILSKFGSSFEKLCVADKLQEIYDIVLAFGANCTDFPMLRYAEHAFLKLDSTVNYSLVKGTAYGIRELNRDTLSFISKRL